MVKSFAQLTNRGRARRLRRIALRALECYALKVTRVRLITNGFNGIFRVDTANGEKYILRIALPEGGHSYEQYCSEMMWLAALSQDSDLSIPEPMPSKKSELVVEVEAEGVPEPRLCMIFSWVSGTDLALQLTPANVEKQGRLMAGLHIHAATFQPPRGFGIYTFDTTFPFPEPIVLLEDRLSDVIPAKRRRLFEEAVKWSENTIADLQVGGEPMRVLHGDLHQWVVVTW